MKPTPHELLDAAARTRVPDSLNLYPRFSSQLERKTLVQTLRAKPALLILSVLLALTLLTGVAYAIGRLAGFIPGFGFTGDTGTVYVLKEPAQVEYDGMTIHMENAVSTEDKFWISLSLSLNGKYPNDQPLFTGATLILSDGTQIPYQAGQENDLNTDPRKASYEFRALPVGTDTLTLRYEFLARDGTVLWTVDIPFTLRPIRADEVIPAPETQAGPLQSETNDGLTLVLDNVAAASNKTILQVSLRFEQPGTSLNTQWGITLIGDDGKIYPLTEVMYDSNNQSKTFETLPFRGGENLTLSLAAFPEATNLPMSVDFPIEQATFTFDPGTSPQVGQSWNLDQQIQVGDYLVHVIGVKQISPTELLFEFAPTSGVTSVALYSSPARGGTGSPPVANANFTTRLFFEKIPTQPITVSITRVGYTARGQWQIQWQAPAAPAGVIVGPTNTSVPTAAVFSTPTIISSDPLLLEVQALGQKFDAPFQQGPGWVHTLKEKEITPRSGQTFPPPYYTSEQWLELDAEGYVLRSLWIDRDQAGNVIQQSVTIGNYWMNFTTGESGYNEYSRYLFSADLLTQDLMQAAQYQAQVTRAEVDCEDGSPCLLVTLFDAFEQAVQHSEDPQPIAGMGRRTWVNLNTGQQIQVQAFSRFQDGSERIEITERSLLVEKAASPPEEVLHLINGVVVP
jgi:hypothetical protein